MLNNLLESYLSSDKTIRKADLISKWIKDYTNYLKFEDNFDPKKNISYKRGNIVKVNFGFNLGSELGGVHYAIVIDNCNPHVSDTITVIPLCSAKDGKEVYKSDLFIGSEFYNTISAKYNNALNETKERLSSLEKTINDVSNLIVSYVSPSVPAADDLITRLQKEADDIKSEINNLHKCKDEIDLMKKGSIVKLNQVRTISKMRIWIPKRMSDPLYNISLSDSTMDKINLKFQELYIFGK